MDIEVGWWNGCKNILDTSLTGKTAFFQGLLEVKNNQKELKNAL